MIKTKRKNLYLFKFLYFSLQTSKNDACNEDWMLLCFIICPLCHVLCSSGDEMLIYKFMSMSELRKDQARNALELVLSQI